jgi:ADP-ribosylglycohydrolase
VAALGNGTGVSAQDTVPFALWCAGQRLGSFEEALWLTVSGLGDRDTTCAIVGGIVALYAGSEAIPAEWLQSRESLPEWAFRDDG